MNAKRALSSSAAKGLVDGGTSSATLQLKEFEVGACSEASRKDTQVVAVGEPASD